MQHTVYHYTSVQKAAEILGKSREERAETGLKPSRHIGLNPLPHDLAAQTATFGFLEPLPDSWVNNPRYPVTWRDLMRTFAPYADGRILLEVGIDTQKDKVFVGDRGHIEDALYASNPIDQELRRKAEDTFMRTMLPLEEYLDKQAKGESEFSLPEVIITHSLPVDRLRVSPQQPLLEKELATIFPQDREMLARNILKANVRKELTPWINKYESEHEPLEIKSGRKEAA